MRMSSMMSLAAAVGAMTLLPLGLRLTADPPFRTDSEPLPLAAGDPPPFLFAAVQPIHAPAVWRAIYRQVERCAGMSGNYDRIRWAVMAAPLQGPKGPTFGFTIGDRIVLVQNDTTYLRHEMLHHVLLTAGWQPRTLGPGEKYTSADLHPMPLFGLCTRGNCREPVRVDLDSKRPRPCGAGRASARGTGGRAR
jgi:hypothetical protein